MEQIRNKDGIVITPGQVWSEHGMERHILCFDEELVVYRNLGLNEVYDCPPCARFFDNLLKSHDGADLEAARAEGWEVLVEGMVEPDEDIEFVELWNDNNGGSWEPLPTFGNREFTYRYKLKAEEPPKYKLFEMDWDDAMCNGPKVKGSLPNHADGVLVSIYPKIGNYRVGWGFTDDPDWDNAWYETEPCDHTGNRKYAIGRYETLPAS